MYKRIVLLAASVLLLAQCTSTEKAEFDETILVKVGDRTISVNEFIRRAEYTIRPAWCKNDNYVHRKIVLNSLIAEKLLAIEAEADGVMLSNPEVQNYLKGRREQAMRRIHYKEMAGDLAQVDSTLLRTVLQMAERTYDVEMIPLNNDALAAEVARRMQNGEMGFDEVFDHLNPDSSSLTPPRESFGFLQPLDDRLLQALFYSERAQGDVIGPLKLDKDRHLLVRIDGWTRRPVIGGAQLQQYVTDVQDKIKEIGARDIYEAHVADLMRGKRVEFNRPIFTELVNAVGPQYFKTSADKERAFNSRFWRRDGENEMVIDDVMSRVEKIRNQVLFSIDGEMWTVADFEEAIQVHPLVFRERKMPQGQFGEQFKLAIVDLLRDLEITKEAYQKGYEKHPAVERDVAMWRDNLLALYGRQNILRSMNYDSLNALQLVENHIDPYISELRQRHSDKISINTSAFEKINLTSVDMFVIQRNVPFPVLVPEFPQLTTHNRLDYGKKM